MRADDNSIFSDLPHAARKLTVKSREHVDKAYDHGVRLPNFEEVGLIWPRMSEAVTRGHLTRLT